jgi:threonine/homoserine/homoserine lactone efflux protein
MWLESVFFLRGLIIGFSIAAPVGPIGVLCIRRTLSEGRVTGLFTGLGAASADAIYGFIAGSGLVFISSVLVSQQAWLRIIGGLFLCFLGVKTILSRPSEHAAPIRRYHHAQAYVSTFFLTLTNPMTILSFAAVFAGFGLSQGSYESAELLVLGVFSGSALWWVILSSLANAFRSGLGTRRLQWVNRISGIIILMFGVLALVSVMQFVR